MFVLLHFQHAKPETMWVIDTRESSKTRKDLDIVRQSSTKTLWGLSTQNGNTNMVFTITGDILFLAILLFLIYPLFFLVGLRFKPGLCICKADTILLEPHL
jgi:hypothetical protein